MEKFIVSARKYRPQDFSTVVGQQHITTTLKNSIRNNTLAHAFLFCGPRGVGKTTCARILAKTINCENLQPDSEACNECSSCKSFNDGISLNIHELDAASNNSVEDIRELVTQVRFAPPDGKMKIYIIDEVHMLSTSAFNAFLKTLEEPPPYAKFILATTEKHKIIPTILSRCQIFDFKRITNNDTTEHLAEIAQKEHIQFERPALQLIAQKSEGCMRDALSILDKIVSFSDGKLTYKSTLEHLNLLDEDVYFLMLEALTNQQLSDALLQFDDINKRGFEGHMMLEGFAVFLRNLLVAKDPKAAVLLDVLEGTQQRYETVAQQISIAYLVSALQVTSEASLQYRDAQNKRLHVEMALIKLCYIAQALDLTVDNAGKLVKRRALEGPVIVRQKPVAPVYQIAKQRAADSAKLIIQPLETPPTKRTSEVPLVKPVPSTGAGSQLSKPGTSPVTPLPKRQVSTGTDFHATPKNLSIYEKLRLEKMTSQATRVQQEARQPNWVEILKLKKEFIEQLRLKGKHNEATSYEEVEIMIEGNEISLKSSEPIYHKGISQALTDFIILLKNFFSNPDILCKPELVEVQKVELPDSPQSLSPLYRYQLMVEKFPLVKELKERLKLTIDS